ncbi:oxidoreductase [Bordetella genomosp. 9]|uniref:Oxidoreductase n=1 Tax=Bordetella genomosp. 9 TaxID=1416803 RepID=A0A261REJ4_9BORD|nr:SDR family NAD(P)-dependent oxidoreductase [Bordetella genomosp. 9]OZI23197.1 oxidoreductase [Bordetella genomosp. 9]
MTYTILVTGASSGFGAMAARALARAGHVVHASMRETAGRNAPRVREIAEWSAAHGAGTRADLRPLELDVQSEPSIEAAVARVLEESGRLDVVVHNAGHMAFGPAEAFTPAQFAELYDINVLGTQRVNRAVLPVLRRQGRGLLLWVGSSSHRGGTPPYLAPYFAAKAAMDALAVSYAGEVARWGIETSIVVPGAFTQGTNHFAHAGSPADQARQAEYDAGPTRGLADEILTNLAACEPPDADPASVARAIVDVVDAPYGRRPFRVHIDPSDDGCAVVGPVADRIRAEFLRRVNLGDLLSPRIDKEAAHGRQ